jgi:hypothetical protein
MDDRFSQIGFFIFQLDVLRDPDHPFWCSYPVNGPYHVFNPVLLYYAVFLAVSHFLYIGLDGLMPDVKPFMS